MNILKELLNKRFELWNEIDKYWLGTVVPPTELKMNLEEIEKDLTNKILSLPDKKHICNHRISYACKYAVRIDDNTIYCANYINNNEINCVQKK